MPYLFYCCSGQYQSFLGQRRNTLIQMDFDQFSDLLHFSFKNLSVDLHSEVPAFFCIALYAAFLAYTFCLLHFFSEILKNQE